MRNRRRSRPNLDVDGEMTYLATGRGVCGPVHMREFRIECFDDGWTMVHAQGVTYPVPPEMTVYEYMHWIFAADVDQTIGQTATGD